MPQLKDKPKSAARADALCQLVDRIAALEQEMATMKAANARRYAIEKPYLKSAGMLPDDEITRDAERLGRAWRKRQK